MNDTVLAEALRDWSQEAEVPHDLAHRVLARRQARRRRLVVPAVAGLATTAVVVAALVVGGTVGPVSTDGGGRTPAGGGLHDVHADTTHNPPQEVVTAGDVALSAIVTYTRVPASPGGWQTLQRRYAVANPTTGRYEPRSWTYAAVAPGLATAAMLEGPLPSSQVGFVDLATGTVTRWVQLDHPVASLAWSPDGSTVLATAYGGDPDLEKPEGKDSFRMGDAKRTGFVLIDVAAGTAAFHSVASADPFGGGRADFGWTRDGHGVRSPSAPPEEKYLDLQGRPVTGADDAAYNTNLYLDAAQFPLSSPDGRFTITQASGLPTAITDNQTGTVYRQQALQVLAWADDEHVVTLAGCSKPCEGTAEFRNGLVLMKYDSTDPVQLTGPRKGVDDWAFELTPR
jgi:dipeptidyl aminopeptidase/acylaminoacyl peptidase